MNDELIERSAAETAAAVNGGEISAVEATRATLQHVRAVDRDVGAYLTVLDDLAMERQPTSDRRVAARRKVAACRRAACR